MLFEVHERHEATVGFRGSVSWVYDTKLSCMLSKKAVMALSL